MLRRRWPVAAKAYLVLAIAAGTGAFLLVRASEQRLAALRPALGSPTPVVLAAGYLPRGTVLAASMLRHATLPAAFVPPGAVTSDHGLMGRVLVADVAGGEVITRTRLAVPGPGPIGALVPEGLRAVVVPSGVPEGTVREGDRVDVLATYGGERAHTETVADAVEVLRVLGAGRSETGSIAGVAGVTTGSDGVELVVLVDSETAERIAFAKAFAQLCVAIEGPITATESPSPGTEGLIREPAAGG